MVNIENSSAEPISRAFSYFLTISEIAISCLHPLLKNVC